MIQIPVSRKTKGFFEFSCVFMSTENEGKLDVTKNFLVSNA